MKKVIVIGGGAAGLMAAYAAAKNGNEVTLIEKNEKLGKKIYITGKGRCNFTNDCDPDTFLQNVVRGGQFLKGAIYRFPPQKTMEFFEEGGLAIKTERGNRVFPASDHASDVTKTLENYCRRAGVTIRLNEAVIAVLSDGERITAVETNLTKYAADAVIVCTGGLSYPSTGSTGDGYGFATENGHKIVETKPALVGINLSDGFKKELQGLSLKNVTLSVYSESQKLLFSQFGEMLFTHFGISGPIVLSASGLINRTKINTLKMVIDLKPALEFSALERRILKDFELYRNKRIVNGMKDLLPQSMILPVLKQAGVQPEKPICTLTKEERTKIINTLKAFAVHPISLRGYEEAIVTSGGVDVKEVNSKTMESKKVKGLYFAGEVLDIDAFTGGFNLQIAFATGFVAGSAIE